jgi:muramoyltetrapeptide carboxypeptidase
MNFKKLQCLQPGDLVDIVSPGSSSRPEDVELCIELLQSWGLRTRLPKETFKAHAFHSNEDEARLNLFKKAVLAKDSKAIWCLRGGYGANRLLPKLWKMPKPPVAKALIGYSDITSLHLLLNQKWNWPSFHGPLLETLASGKVPQETVQETREVVFGKATELKFKIKPMNPLASKMKTLNAPLAGGNLLVLESGLGTPYAPDFAGKILVLEEIGERGYRIDRMLEHFLQAGRLKKCKAIVFGDFLLGDERDGKNFVQYALERFAAQNLIACFSGLEIGHGSQNRMVPLGTTAKFTGKAGKGELIVSTGFQVTGKKR